MGERLTLHRFELEPALDILTQRRRFYHFEKPEVWGRRAMPKLNGSLEASDTYRSYSKKALPQICE